MELSTTNRGFWILRFKDIYDADCTLQESSLGDRHAIWFGCGEDRMHIDADLFEQLAPQVYAMLGMADPAAEIAKLREDLAEAVMALEMIADGMIFPNQMESGFVHGKPTFADMQARIDFARATASHALAKIKGE